MGLSLLQFYFYSRNIIIFKVILVNEGILVNEHIRTSLHYIIYKFIWNKKILTLYTAIKLFPQQSMCKRISK